MKAKKESAVGKTVGKVLEALNKEDIREKLTEEFEKNRKIAEREIAKVKKKLEGTLTKAENYVKKNPEKATMIALGIGAALATAVTLYAKGKKKGTPKKKK